MAAAHFLLVLHKKETGYKIGVKERKKVFCPSSLGLRPRGAFDNLTIFSSFMKLFEVYINKVIQRSMQKASLIIIIQISIVSFANALELLCSRVGLINRAKAKITYIHSLDLLTPDLTGVSPIREIMRRKQGDTMDE